jgi:BirA family transcriptional regulator, biotin operon repressor / biotin---[acetyl-CoA-carboxylase] ligase
MYLKIVTLGSVISTNDHAWELVNAGAKEITVVRADTQTKGRGRMGRSWISGQGGLYASFVLTPVNPIQELYFLPLVMAMAVAKVLSRFVEVKLKWPNDVLCGNKKIAGILVEVKRFKGVGFVVAGIGININTAVASMPDTATSLYIASGKEYNITEIFNGLLAEEIKVYKKFKAQGPAVFWPKISRLAVGFDPSQLKNISSTIIDV